ncbi:MAG: MBL fold metallo-hydrolase [Lachnospiraceae bacterium]|nr:MBL fold metallo-hydrolase [Lachnospiraceae bacterium]
MNITYLGHSGFLLEFDKAYFLFDYYTGQIPPLNPDKKLYIFVSHAHGDHYNSKIWTMRKTYPKAYFIVSTDVPLGASQKLRLGLTKPDEKAIIRAKADEVFRLSDELRVETLKSTDEGVAFIIKYEDKTIFHAGDLNLWTWPGDDGQVNNGRMKRFIAEMDKIKGQAFDVAFFPLDPRQEEACGEGLKIFLDMTETVKLFPMHMWGDFAVIDSYLKKYPVDSSKIMRVEGNGQMFQID